MSGSRGRTCAALVLFVSLVVAVPPAFAADDLAPACPEGTVPSSDFRDVPDDSVHEAAIDCLAWRDIVDGTGERSYRPVALVTRGQSAAILARLFEDRQIPMARDTRGYYPFTDIDGTTHETAIKRLAHLDIVNGDEGGRFRPEAPVTRGQLASLIVRSFHHAANLDTSRARVLPRQRDAFRDGAGVHEESVERLAGAGIASGHGDGTFDAAARVRRDQTASFVARTLACLSRSPAHEDRCDENTLNGFDVAVHVEPAVHRPGDDVDVSVEACNRRDESLRQTFPQKDWLFVEAVNLELPDHNPFRNLEDGLDFYRTRADGRSPDGMGYDGPRDDHRFRRLLGKRGATEAVTWWDGPQQDAGDVVTWAAGECKRVPIGSWGQMGNRYWPDGCRRTSPETFEDYPCAWTHTGVGHPRAKPGRYLFRVHWGGQEVGESRRRLLVDSAPFALAGVTVGVDLDRAELGYDRDGNREWGDYDEDEPVGVIVEACNHTSAPHAAAPEKSGTVEVFTVLIRGNAGSHWRAHEIGRIEAEAAELHWEPGECKEWELTWDQQWDDGSKPEENERFQIDIDWRSSMDEGPEADQNPYSQRIFTASFGL